MRSSSPLRGEGDREGKTMIRVGPAGWSYEGWEGIVYPPHKGTKFDPLSFLADLFDTIEVNNSFYRPPTPQAARSWAVRVEGNPRFKFTVKLYRNFTHERQLLTETDEGDFKKGLEPLVETGRFGALLLQFPYSFHHRPENRNYLLDLIRKFRDYPLVVEVRHASWDRASTYQLLRETRVGFCNLDQPPVSYSLGPTRKVTSPVGYLRLHGRNLKDWFREGTERDARYDYLYNEFEISEITQRIRQIAMEAEETYVIANNHYRGKAACNALEIRARLGEKGLKVPATLLAHFPQLEEIMKKEEPGAL